MFLTISYTCCKNFPDLQKVSGQHCSRTDGVFVTLSLNSLLSLPEGGVSWENMVNLENMENIEKMENVNQMT